MAPGDAVVDGGRQQQCHGVQPDAAHAERVGHHARQDAARRVGDAHDGDEEGRLVAGHALGHRQVRQVGQGHRLN